MKQTEALERKKRRKLLKSHINETSENITIYSPISKQIQLENYIHKDWKKLLEEEFAKPYFIKIKKFLQQNRDHLPPVENIFTCLNYFRPTETKIVIIGQDPYHNPGQAMGLSFSVPIGVKIPPSLRNIYKELKNDIQGFKEPSNGDLTKWTKTRSTSTQQRFDGSPE